MCNFISEKFVIYVTFAKQHKSSFQKSDTDYLNAFDLIYVDVWGSIVVSFVHGHKYFLTEDKTWNQTLVM